MTPYLRRTHQRRYFHTPVKYAYLDTGEYFDSRMTNISKEGMYFESGRPVSTDSNIHIVMTNYPVVAGWPDMYRNYTAVIKWCGENSFPGAPLFGVGVHFLTQSNIITGDHLDKLLQTCDLCGKMMPFNEMALTERSAYICPFCSKHMEAIPNGSIKSSIENFMIGNVL